METIETARLRQELKEAKALAEGRLNELLEARRALSKAVDERDEAQRKASLVAEFYIVRARGGGSSSTEYVLKRGHVKKVDWTRNGDLCVATISTLDGTLTAGLTKAECDALVAWVTSQFAGVRPQVEYIREALGARRDEPLADAAKRVAGERDSYYKEREDARHELAQITDVVRSLNCGVPAGGSLAAVKHAIIVCERRGAERDAAQADLMAIRDKVDPDAFAEASYNECELKIASLNGNPPTLWDKLPAHERAVLKATARKMLARFVPQARLKPAPEMRTYDAPNVKITFGGRELRGWADGDLFVEAAAFPRSRHDDMVDALKHALGTVGASYVFCNPPYKSVAQHAAAAERQAARQQAKVWFFPFGPDGRLQAPKVTLADPPVRHVTLRQHVSPYNFTLKRYQAVDLTDKAGIAGGKAIRWCGSLAEAERIARELNEKPSPATVFGGYTERIGGSRLNYAVIDWLPGANTAPAPAPAPAPARYCVTDYSASAASVDITLKQRIASGAAKIVVWFGSDKLGRDCAETVAEALNNGYGCDVAFDPNRRGSDAYAVVDTVPGSPAPARTGRPVDPAFGLVLDTLKQWDALLGIKPKAPAVQPAPSDAVFCRFRVFDIAPGGLWGSGLRADIDAGKYKPVAWFASVAVACEQADKLNRKRTRPDDYDPRCGAGENYAVIDTRPNA